MNIIGNPNDWVIEVEPKCAGDYGFASISSIRYTSDEAKDLQREMQSDIERHIDRVRYTRVVYNSYICEDCNASGDSEKEVKAECSCSEK